MIMTVHGLVVEIIAAVSMDTVVISMILTETHNIYNILYMNIQ